MICGYPYVTPHIDGIDAAKPAPTICGVAYVGPGAQTIFCRSHMWVTYVGRTFQPFLGSEYVGLVCGPQRCSRFLGLNMWVTYVGRRVPAVFRG